MQFLKDEHAYHFLCSLPDCTLFRIVYSGGFFRISIASDTYIWVGVRALIKSCWVGSCRERARDVTITTIEIPGIWNFRNSGIPVSFHILCK